VDDVELQNFRTTRQWSVWLVWYEQGVVSDLQNLQEVDVNGVDGFRSLSAKPSSACESFLGPLNIYLKILYYSRPVTRLSYHLLPPQKVFIFITQFSLSFTNLSV
jgi:hypothetical protein